MERRLSAIMAADVVGYSKMIRADEEGTIDALKRLREDIINPKISEHHGRTVKLMGDGMLVEFPSVVDAVRTALKAQNAIAARNASLSKEKQISFRIGINLGDVVIDGDDIQGDGVNIAARLEGLAQAGGICISESVHDQVRDRIEVVFEDIGEQQLKNIARPLRVWRWLSGEAQAPAKNALSSNPPDRPSIAVLPFENMSGDPDQEYFVDGIVEDVITALSKFRSLFVIARTSSFTYKGSEHDTAQVARELGVRYLVEGSVRKAGNRVRITAQLAEAINGSQIWADRFDGTLEDVFNLQDQITEQIVVAIEPEIQSSERERARRKPPDNLDAWELLQRGLSHYYRFNKNDHEQAIRLFEDAIHSDPEFSLAHAFLGFALWISVFYGYTTHKKKTLIRARTAAEKAVSLDPKEAMAHFVLGRLQLANGEAEMAVGEMQTAIAINPNFALGYYGLGHAYCTGAGQPEKALPYFDVALRLSPRDPLRRMPLMLKGAALRQLGRFEESITYCRRACQVPDSGFLPHMHLAAALAEAGQYAEAKAEISKAKRLQPSLSISFIRSNFFGLHETYLNGLIESMRKAGLKE